jgi:hypothetical protein
VPPHLSNKAMPVSGEEDTEDAHDGVRAGATGCGLRSRDSAEPRLPASGC